MCSNLRLDGDGDDGDDGDAPVFGFGEDMVLGKKGGV